MENEVKVKGVSLGAFFAMLWESDKKNNRKQSKMKNAEQVKELEKIDKAFADVWKRWDEKEKTLTNGETKRNEQSDTKLQVNRISTTRSETRIIQDKKKKLQADKVQEI